MVPSRDRTASAAAGRSAPPARPSRGGLLAALATLCAAAPGTAAAAEGTNGAAAADVVCYGVSAEQLACYEKPRPFGFVLNLPGDIGGLVRDGFRRENALTLAVIAAATAGLLLVDQDLVDGAHDLGRRLHVSEGRTGKTPGVPIPYPTDAGSALYYIGDGMVPVLITAGMLGYGWIASDRRALQTTSHLVEGLLSVAIVAQTVKHLTGRQSPSRATEPGGEWRPFTNPATYHENVPAFDAFPSGHMATAMVAVTVLAEDYPEYRLIRPIGYGLMTLLGFQMLNNDVHWASDYPLAIAVGYGLGKRAASHGRKAVPAADAPGPVAGQGRRPEVSVLPLPLHDGGGLLVLGSF